MNAILPWIMVNLIHSYNCSSVTHGKIYKYIVGFGLKKSVIHGPGVYAVPLKVVYTMFNCVVGIRIAWYAGPCNAHAYQLHTSPRTSTRSLS